jgi:hypothetical protein
MARKVIHQLNEQMFLKRRPWSVQSRRFGSCAILLNLVDRNFLGVERFLVENL